MTNPLTHRILPFSAFNRLTPVYLLLLVPVLVHVGMVYQFSSNMPYLDDYTFIVDVLNLKSGHLTPR